MTDARPNSLDPAVVNLRIDNLERRMRDVEVAMKPIPVLVRDVEKGFLSVDTRMDTLSTAMNDRMKNLTRVLWIFAGAFITAAMSTLFLALQIATGR